MSAEGVHVALSGERFHAGTLAGCDECRVTSELQRLELERQRRVSEERRDRVQEQLNVRLMRGQVVVREIVQASDVLWTPDARPRDVKTHTGEVLALGPPARLTEHPDSPEVPHGFVVGDVVQYHFGAVGTQAARTRTWTDGKPATWLTQAEIDGVWEGEEDHQGFVFTPEPYPLRVEISPEVAAMLDGEPRP